MAKATTVTIALTMDGTTEMDSMPVTQWQRRQWMTVMDGAMAIAMGGATATGMEGATAMAMEGTTVTQQQHCQQ
jgi:hypothetical protein